MNNIKILWENIFFGQAVEMMKFLAVTFSKIKMGQIFKIEN